MAAYPSYAQLSGSTRDLRDDLDTDFAVDGGLHQRSFYATIKHDFKLRHLLTKAEKEAFMDGSGFYPTNRLQTVTFKWTADGQTYTCRFKKPPRESWVDGWFVVDVELVEA